MSLRDMVLGFVPAQMVWLETPGTLSGMWFKKLEALPPRQWLWR